MFRSMLLGACLAAGAVAPCLADPLDVKTGLWELTSGAPASAGTAAPQIPADALAKLTPEQKAMVQQRLAAANGAGGRKPITRKICVTQTTLEKGPRDHDTGSCTRTQTAATSQMMEFHLVCTGTHASQGTIRVEAAGEETISINVDMTVANNGQNMPIKHSTQGHWVAADCGSVKPDD